MRPTYRTRIVPDSTTDRVSAMFDYAFTGERVFEGWEKPNVPSSFTLGLIVGPSGSGKSLLLSSFGQEKEVAWEETRAIVSQFSDSDEAIERLTAVGLNTVPAWCSPFHTLSTGEQFRANTARQLTTGTVVDEFTSVVDRTVAKTVCNRIHAYAHKHGLQNIVLASCHYDIVPWLRPDWYFDTGTGILHDGRSLQRPKISVRIYPCKRSIWSMFENHHYLTKELAKSARCYLATADFDGDERIVGFVSCLPMPSGTLKNAWRGHRTVVLPDFQGLGIGPRISDAIAQIYVDRGDHYYSRTAHPRFGGYRDKPGSGWIRTVESGKHRATSRRRANGKADIAGMGDSRICFSHEYIGTKKYDNWWEV